MQRRALVLGDERARHWLRASLPPSAVEDLSALTEARPSGRITAQDLRDFLVAYCSCFIALIVWFL